MMMMFVQPGRSGKRPPLQVVASIGFHQLQVHHLVLALTSGHSPDRSIKVGPCTGIYGDMCSESFGSSASYTKHNRLDSGFQRFQLPPSARPSLLVVRYSCSTA